MATDSILAKGAYQAHKNWDNVAGMYSGLDKVAADLKTWQETKLAEQKDNDKRNKALSAKLSKTITDGAVGVNNLGKDALDVYKDKTRGLRDKYLQAVNDGDTDLAEDYMIELNEIIANSQKSKDGHEALVDGIKSEIYDYNAMTDEEKSAIQNFTDNPTRRFTTNQNGEDAYSWDVLDEFGEPIQKVTPAGDLMFNFDGTPIYETQTFTLDELNDMTAPQQNDSGMALRDYESTESTAFAEGGSKSGTEPKVDDVRGKVDEIIPQITDIKGLKSWYLSNPTKDRNLDIKELLTQSVSNFKKFSDLGVIFEDMNVQDQQVEGEEGFGVIDVNDLVTDEDKDEFLNKIMNVEYPEISRAILVEAMTLRTYDKITGQAKDYTPGSEVMLDGTTELVPEEKLEDAQKLTRLQEGVAEGESPTSVAERLQIKLTDKLWDPKRKNIITGKQGDWVTIMELYPDADPTKKKKVAKVKQIPGPEGLEIIERGGVKLADGKIIKDVYSWENSEGNLMFYRDGRKPPVEFAEEGEFYQDRGSDKVYEVVDGEYVEVPVEKTVYERKKDADYYKSKVKFR